jgi:NYN domain
MSSIFAYIDAQNLHLGIRGLGWELDYRRFRIYLLEKHKVDVAYLFIGFVASNSAMYQELESYGYKIIFKETIRMGNGVKGNCDAELVMQAMMDLPFYQQAILVSGDGDFACLIKYLYTLDKLKLVLVPDQDKYSALIKKTAIEKIDFVSSLRHKLAKKSQAANGLNIQLSVQARQQIIKTKSPVIHINDP